MPSKVEFERVVPRRRVQKVFTKPSRTHQEFKDECDINKIMKKFEKTALLTHVNKHPGGYGDFSSAPDYQEALNIVLQATEMFDSVPSHIRKQFGNDPAQFLAFVEDPANAGRMVEMGLATASVGGAERAPNAGVATPTVAPKGANKEVSKEADAS